jgi:ATP-dependent DNA helicase RecQ
MDFLQVVQQRRAVREYRDTPVDAALIERLLGVAVLAPSAMNLQPWAFAVITGAGQIDEYARRAKDHLLAEANPSNPRAHELLSDPDLSIFYHAPALVLVLARSDERQAKEDCCLAAQVFMLAARDAGLGTCWIGFGRPWLDLPKTKVELGLPQDYHVVAPIVLGFPQTWPPPHRRHAPEIHWAGHRIGRSERRPPAAILGRGPCRGARGVPAPLWREPPKARQTRVMTHGAPRRPIQADLSRIARRLFGFERFRTGQEPAIRALLQGHDVLAVLPTGAGKSAIYQIAAAVMTGPTVVVSPLIALQRDQAQRLEAPEAGGAAIINSLIALPAQREAFDELARDALEFLFLAPEQLQRREVLERLQEARPSLFVVDEAHCISEWGHDFRPDYLRLAGVIRALGHPRVLALTATATARVREEIVERLAMQSPRIIVGDLDRPNIWLGVRRCRDAAKKREALLHAVQTAEGPGIVYVATRRHAVELAAALGDVGVHAACYHGGMSRRERETAQQEFMAGSTGVVVATSAFGMGVDKPDVRFVYHFDVPGSLEAYYQAFGRAGRDGKSARVLLFYRPEDLALHKFFAGGGRLRGEDLETVAEALQMVAEVDLEALRHMTELSRSTLAKAATELEDQGLITQTGTGQLRAGLDLVDHWEAADTMRERQEKLRARVLQSLDRMRIYAELRDCRRRYLLEYFGQESGPCGRCDNCEAGLPRESAREDEPFLVKTRIAHKKLGKGMVVGYHAGHMTILFDEGGEKTIDLTFARAHDLLSRA